MSIACGAFAQGPLLLVPDPHSRADLTFLDSKTLRDLPLTRIDDQLHVRVDAMQGSLLASADGTMFCGTSPLASDVTCLQIQGKEYRIAREHVSPGYLAIDYSGKNIYTAAGKYSNTLKPLTERTRDLPSEMWISAVDSDWSLRLSKDGKGAFYAPGVQQPSFAIELTPLPVHPGDFGFPARKSFFFSSQGVLFHLNPEATVQTTTIDIASELARVDAPYLAVLSTPDSSAQAGQLYRYRPMVASNTAEFEINLWSAPAGMRYDAAQHELSWAVPDNAAAPPKNGRGHSTCKRVRLILIGGLRCQLGRRAASWWPEKRRLARAVHYYRRGTEVLVKAERRPRSSAKSQ